MAAVALVGGDDNARWSRGKEAEEGRVLEGERGEVQAVEGKCVALRDDSSSGKQAGGGRTRARARRPRARPPGKGKTTGRSPWWAGPASYSAGPVGGAR